MEKDISLTQEQIEILYGLVEGCLDVCDEDDTCKELEELMKKLKP